VSGARVLLSPLASLYGAAMRMRNRRYDRPGASLRAPVPVVSVGNLTLGGTGKTPMVAWVSRRLVVDGRRPAVVSRGYGGTAGTGPLVVSDGDGPRVDAARCGDEPWMLARTLAGVRVLVGSDRVAGAREAAARGADVVVLDDGYQHRRLARDLDVLLVDAGTPLRSLRVLPAGTLREPLEGLVRADVVILTRHREGPAAAENERTVRELNPRAVLLRAVHRAAGFVDSEGQAVEAPHRAVAFCAIGNPTAFRDDLAARGVDVSRFRPFRDHHEYTAEEIEGLARQAGEVDAVPVTTEKDLARLGPSLDRFGERRPVALRVEVELADERPLLQAIRAATSGAEPSP
jgi:tetraacyldisaccharide 4'-kinase